MRGKARSAVFARCCLLFRFLKRLVQLLHSLRRLKTMNTRIGRKLLITIIICIVLASALISTIIIFTSSSNTDALMMSHAEAGLRILQHRLDEQQRRLDQITEDMTSSDFALSEDESTISDYWSTERDSDFDFIAVFNKIGRASCRARVEYSV